MRSHSSYSCFIVNSLTYIVCVMRESNWKSRARFRSIDGSSIKMTHRQKIFLELGNGRLWERTTSIITNRKFGSFFSLLERPTSIDIIFSLGKSILYSL